jgi:iron complex outermembrane recepter protein
MSIETTEALFDDNPIYSGSTDPAAQAAYKLAYAEAKALILGAVPEGSAEQLASLWTRYNFVSGALKDWWIAGGFVHTGDKAQRSANPTLFLPASTIFDLTLGKNWNVGKMKWSATLAWKNVADTEYWNANQARGQPGRVILSVATRF